TSAATRTRSTPSTARNAPRMPPSLAPRPGTATMVNRLALKRGPGRAKVSDVYAVTIAAPGGPEVLQWTEVPDPVPGSGEVLIEGPASAVNRADLLQRQGFYPPPPGGPPYPGLECAGRIAALGDGVLGWSLGDEVCALLGGGGYAEKAIAPVGQLLPI